MSFFEPGGGFLLQSPLAGRSGLDLSEKLAIELSSRCDMIDRTGRAKFSRATNRGNRRCGPIQIGKILEFSLDLWANRGWHLTA